AKDRGLRLWEVILIGQVGGIFDALMFGVGNRVILHLPWDFITVQILIVQPCYFVGSFITYVIMRRLLKTGLIKKNDQADSQQAIKPRDLHALPPRFHVLPSLRSTSQAVHHPRHTGAGTHHHPPRRTACSHRDRYCRSGHRSWFDPAFLLEGSRGHSAADSPPHPAAVPGSGRARSVQSRLSRLLPPRHLARPRPWSAADGNGNLFL